MKVDELMARFNSIVDTFVAPRFLKCDVASVIQDNEWNDELHPTPKGFEDAAQVFHPRCASTCLRSFRSNAPTWVAAFRVFIAS